MDLLGTFGNIERTGSTRPLWRPGRTGAGSRGEGSVDLGRCGNRSAGACRRWLRSGRAGHGAADNDRGLTSMMQDPKEAILDLRKKMQDDGTITVSVSTVRYRNLLNNLVWDG